MLVHLDVLALAAVALDQLLLALDGGIGRAGHAARAGIGCLALDEVGGVGAPEDGQAASAQLPDALDDVVQEGPVVRGHDERAVALHERHLEPLERGDVEAAQQRIRELLERRSATQPTTQPSCGSTFRNPANDHAARLIESIGLKGHCIGGACVSRKHANFIINDEDATASDIEQLVDYVQQQVAERCGVELVREVHIVGEVSHEES